MRALLLSAIAAANAACATTSVDARPTVRSEGLGSDLRVMFDDNCLPPEPDEESLTIGGDLLAQLAVGAGTMMFKTFGRMIQEAGAPKLDRSSAVRGGFMYEVDGPSSSFNRGIGCVHIVRGGFGADAPSFARAPSALAATWTRLGLKGEPSLYAQVRLTPVAEAPAYFRGELLQFIAPRFERNDARNERDYLLVMEFERPTSTAYIAATGEGGFAYAQPGAFARGVFKLTDVRKNFLLDERALAYLETGLMPVGARSGQTDPGAFNLFIDVIEFKRGDPLLADIGALFRSEKVENAATNMISQQVNRDATRRSEAMDRFDAIDSERKLIQALEAEVRQTRQELGATPRNPSRLALAANELDDAIAAVDRRRGIFGWASPEGPETALAVAREVLREARAARE